jgi:hypothetical protein
MCEASRRRANGKGNVVDHRGRTEAHRQVLDFKQKGYCAYHDFACVEGVAQGVADKGEQQSS